MRRRALVLIVVGCALARPVWADLRIGGYLSAEYLKGQRQSAFARGSFANAEAGAVFSGELSTEFAAVLEVRSRDGMRFEVEQAWAGFLWSDAIHVKAGVFLVPFGVHNPANRPFETRLVQPPLPVSEIYPASWREVGILAEGKTGVLRYAAFLGNGLAEAADFRSGQQFKDNNSDKAWGGRVGILLGTSFEVGASYYTGKVDAENTRGLVLRGLDLAWSESSARVTAEYVKAEVENPAPYSTGTAEGFYVTASLDIGAFSPLVAYEKYRAEDAFHGAGFGGPLASGQGIFDNRSVWAVGFVVALHPNLRLKCEYDFQAERNLVLANNVFRAQIAAHF